MSAALIIAQLENNVGAPKRYTAPVPLQTETDRQYTAELSQDVTVNGAQARVRETIRQLMVQASGATPVSGSLSDYALAFVSQPPPQVKLIALMDGKEITLPPSQKKVKNDFVDACTTAGMSGEAAYVLILRTLYAVGRPFWPVVLQVYQQYGLMALYEVLALMPSVNVRGVPELNSTGSMVQRATATRFAKGTTLRPNVNWEGSSRKNGAVLEDNRFDIQKHAGGVLFYDDKGIQALAKALEMH